MCGRKFPDDRTVCPDDGVALIVMNSSGLPRVSDTTRSGGPPMSQGPPRQRHSGPVVMRPLGSASMIGQTVSGRYVIEEKIGSGGMGVVYRARQLLVDRSVALKILPRDLADDTAAAKRFTNEAKAISQLRHPNIVTLYDFGLTEDGRPFIAMEFVAGRTLTEVIKAGPLDPRAATDIVRQVAHALQAAHDMGIIHRDIKADNVMIEHRTIGSDQVRVLDFGIARQVDSDQRLTQTGIVFATPQYCSPEQALGQTLDNRSDLYSVGVLFFEMLAGRLPFTDKVGSLLLHKHINEVAPRLSDAAPGRSFAPGLERVVAALLEKDPARRPPSCRVLLELLDAVAHGDPEPRATAGFEDAHAESVDTAALLPLESTDTAALLGERDATPLPAHRPHNRLSLWLALGIGSAVAAGAVSLLLPTEPASEGSPGHAIAATRALTPPPAVAPPSLAPSATAAASASAAPAATPPLDPRLLAGLRGAFVPPQIPAWVLSADPNAPVPPLPGVATPPAGADPVAHLADLEKRLAAAPPASPDAARLQLEVANARWSRANLRFAEERLRFEAEAAAFMAGRLAQEPSPPRPDYDDACAPLEAWLSAHAADPAAPDVLFALGVAHIGAARRDTGIAHLQRLVTEHPESPAAGRARRPLADHLFFDAQKPAEARTAYAARLRDAPPAEAAYLRFMIAYAAYNAGDFAGAAQAFKAVLADLPADATIAAHYRQPALDALALTFVRLPDGAAQAEEYFGAREGRPLVVKQLKLMARLQQARAASEQAVEIYGRLLRGGTSATAEEITQLVEEIATLDVRGKPTDALVSLCDDLLKHPSAQGLPKGTHLLLRALRAAAAVATGKLTDAAELKPLLDEASLLARGGDATAGEAYTAAEFARLELAMGAIASLPVARAVQSEQLALTLTDDLRARMRTLGKSFDALAVQATPAWVVRIENRRGEAWLQAMSLFADIAGHPPGELDAAGAARFRARAQDEVVKAADAARGAFQNALKRAETLRDAERLTQAAQDGLRRVAQAPAPGSDPRQP
jgi:serine/threonine protein kinase/tetratricopeptide (TPR) repeat protein